ncbi:hypothetical protein B0H17DRAFT_502649 [Mycena rosella]|uniref:Uncharacterized protein n=1 Tax=Mycena rosella TaxID=1033263 RepID=A0AAD7FU33_MYCRO|nr:hypothetical protein B0H17DRAFT_502649 [Mycena rosella]
MLQFEAFCQWMQVRAFFCLHKSSLFSLCVSAILRTSSIVGFGFFICIWCAENATRSTSAICRAGGRAADADVRDELDLQRAPTARYRAHAGALAARLRHAHVDTPRRRRLCSTMCSTAPRAAARTRWGSYHAAMWTGVAFGGLGELYSLIVSQHSCSNLSFLFTSRPGPLPLSYSELTPLVFFVTPSHRARNWRIAMSSMRGDSHGGNSRTNAESKVRRILQPIGGVLVSESCSEKWSVPTERRASSPWLPKMHSFRTGRVHSLGTNPDQCPLHSRTWCPTRSGFV